MNFGNYECDDGNNIDGDGCSSDCNVEAGFKCTSNKNGPDVCIDTTSPEMIITVLKNNVIQITFTKEVISIVSSNYLHKFRRGISKLF